MESTMTKPTRLPTIAMLAAVAFATGAAAEEKFQKLTGAQLRTKIVGMELSDEVHWRDFYDRGGKLTSSSMGRKRTGKWRVEKDQLCTEFEKETMNCYEVWTSGKKVKLQREGILPLEGVIAPPTGRM
jgi:hypothetical protein